jgi:hypothetical protein
VSLTVEVGGSPTPTLQWYLNGGPISNGGRVSGATSTTLTVTPSEAPDAGTYTVVATNRVTSTTSAGANITIVPAGLSAAHSVSGPGYKAGTTVTINGTLNYSGTATSLGWQVLLPAGWSYEGGSGSEGDIRPLVGQTDALEWAWSAPPVSPVSFSYTLRVPSTESGNRSIAGLAIVRLTGSTSFFQLLAKPDPLSVRQVRNHSADTDANFRISLLELTRVIELYNTRAGTSRTGCYGFQLGTEDGFAPDTGRAASVVVSLPAYHSADYDRNGRLGLIELTRVIELYNTRSGTSRTGEYSVQEGTEDGFAPGSGITTPKAQIPAP